MWEVYIVVFTRLLKCLSHVLIHILQKKVNFRINHNVPITKNTERTRVHKKSLHKVLNVSSNDFC